MDRAAPSFMDIAASLKAHPEKLQRSISSSSSPLRKRASWLQIFAAHPTVVPKSIVADVNVDMFLPIVPLKILKIEGSRNPISACMPRPSHNPWA